MTELLVQLLIWLILIKTRLLIMIYEEIKVLEIIAFLILDYKYELDTIIL
jgi:hypothetical protein